MFSDFQEEEEKKQEKSLFSGSLKEKEEWSVVQGVNRGEARRNVSVLLFPSFLIFLKCMEMLVCCCVALSVLLMSCLFC